MGGMPPAQGDSVETAHGGRQVDAGSYKTKSSLPAIESRPALRQRALRLLARREHSRAELARKLTPYAASPEDLDHVLDALSAATWLDDRRAAESLVRQQAPGRGLRRLRECLAQRGIDADTTQAVLAPLAEGEADRARALWQRRFGQPPRSPADFARQFRFLVGRGFAPDVVQRLLRQALKDAGGVIDPA